MVSPVWSVKDDTNLEVFVGFLVGSSRILTLATLILEDPLILGRQKFHGIEATTGRVSENQFASEWFGAAFFLKRTSKWHVFFDCFTCFPNISKVLEVNFQCFKKIVTELQTTQRLKCAKNDSTLPEANIAPENGGFQ